jgi:hypothetical protein
MGTISQFMRVPFIQVHPVRPAQFAWIPRVGRSEINKALELQSLNFQISSAIVKVVDIWIVVLSDLIPPPEWWIVLLRPPLLRYSPLSKVGCGRHLLIWDMLQYRGELPGSTRLWEAHDDEIYFISPASWDCSDDWSNYICLLQVRQDEWRCC